MCPCENAESCVLGANRRVTCNCLPGFTGEFCRERFGKLFIIFNSSQTMSMTLYNFNQLTIIILPSNYYFFYP